MGFSVACIQMNSNDDLAENIKAAGLFVRAAAHDGANLICLPENAFLMAVGKRFHSQVFTADEHPALTACRELAAELGVWLLIGSLAVKDGSPPHPASAKAQCLRISPSLHNPLPQGRGKQAEPAGEGDKYLNRSYLINDKGDVAAHYDKIHLFDVALPSGETHEESARFAHGDKAVVAPTPWGELGMSICYDVRFPYLYRALALRGADFLSIPAAFTRFTGEKGGWHVLCRARAMETGCFVFAPAQCGEHAGGRKTYGHSLIVNPWGDILAEADGEAGIISAEIDPQQVQKTRAIMPSLRHDREFE